MYLRETAGEGRGPRPTPPPSSLPLLMALSVQMCFRGPLPQTLPPASDSQAASPAHKLGQRPAPGGAARTRIRDSESVSRGGAAPGGWARAFRPWRLWPQRRPRSRDPFRNLWFSFPLKRKPTHPADFGVQSVKGVCCLVVFWLSPSLWGTGREGSAPVLSQRPIGLPTPSCSICEQRAKCPPPSRKKQHPLTSKMVGGAERGDGSTPSPKRESKLKKI